MKITTSILFALLLVTVSCKDDKYVAPEKGSAAFSLAPIAMTGGRINGTSSPAFVLLNIKDRSGAVQENVKISLYAFGQSYVSENIDLAPGIYQLTQFEVLDASNKIIYATPIEGSNFAKYVTDPLPLEFTVARSTTTQIVPQVLPVSSTDVPSDFGYASFGFEVVNSNSVVLVKAKVLIAVGHVIYENLDALIRVKGYDTDNTMQWTTDYNFIGPEDTLEVKNGFDHYSIELVDKWGINDIQSDILAKDIWEGRADGPAPNTFVLSGSKEAKKLSSSVFSNEVDMPGEGIVYQFNLRDLYTYNDFGSVESIRHQIYNTQTLQFEEGGLETFTYEGLRVKKIVVTHPNGYVDKEYWYEYAVDYGRANKITENNLTIGFVVTQVLIKDYSSDHPKVLMTESFSNGHVLSYEFDVLFKNIQSDKTTNDSELCSKGVYEYDKYINPFRHLGYMDFDLQNWSASNKVSTNIDFVGCGYPSLIPLFHYYTYDRDGFPTQVVTKYKSGSGSNNTWHTKNEFYYK